MELHKSKFIFDMRSSLEAQVYANCVTSLLLKQMVNTIIILARI